MEHSIQLLTDPQSVSEYARQAVAAIIDGEIDPLIAFVNLSKAKRVIDEVVKHEEVLRLATDYVEAHGSNREMQIGDCSAKIGEAGVSYDYSVCGDPEMERLLAEADALKERIKTRETFLRGIKGHLALLDEDTGEVRDIYPPARTSKTTLKLTFSK